MGNVTKYTQKCKSYLRNITQLMQKNFLSNSEYKCKYALLLLTLQIRKRITGSRLSLALRRLRMEDKFKGSMGCTA